MRVVDNSNGDDATPTNTGQNRYSTNLMLFKFKKLILLTLAKPQKTNVITIIRIQTNLHKRLFNTTDNCYIKNLNLNKTPSNSAVNDAPGYNHLFNHFHFLF